MVHVKLLLTIETTAWYCNFAYLPNEVGEFAVNITYNDFNITGSPFQPVKQMHHNFNYVHAVGIQPYGMPTKSCSFDFKYV